MSGDRGSPQTEFLEQFTLIARVVRFVCTRHRLSEAEAEEFSSLVNVKLIEDDYAILRKFEGRSSLRTYLTVVVERLFLDYRTSCWGKWRPSAEARRVGPIGILLERLLVRDGYSFDEACEILRTNHRVPYSRDEIAAMGARLPLRVPRRFETEDVLAQLPAPSAPPDVLLVAQDQQQVSERVRHELGAAIAHLDSRDRLVLTMRYLDGWTVAQIARALQLDQKALYRRLDALLRGLRTELEALGVQAETVRQMFGGLDLPEGPMEPPTAHGEIFGERPSKRKGASSWS